MTGYVPAQMKKNLRRVNVSHETHGKEIANEIANFI